MSVVDDLKTDRAKDRDGHLKTDVQAVRQFIDMAAWTSVRFAHRVNARMNKSEDVRDEAFWSCYKRAERRLFEAMREYETVAGLLGCEPVPKPSLVKRMNHRYNGHDDPGYTPGG